jgi:hypothetical protein
MAIVTTSKMSGIRRTTYWTMDCTTIDSSPNEEQKPNHIPFLVAARQHWPDHMDHANVHQCISNLITCVQQKQSLDMPGDARIVGHGNCGYLATGAGQGAAGPEQILSEWSSYTWSTEMEQLRPSSLQLWACKTGGGEYGTGLLWHLARLTKCQVTAPTGCVFGDGHMQPGSTWQIGRPGAASPEPVITPPPDPPDLTKLADIIATRGMERLTFALPTNDTLRGLFHAFGNSHSFEGTALTRALAQLEVGRPFKTVAGPAATLTGYLLIHTGQGESTRRLTIYCDSIISDSARPDYYMYLSKTATRFVTDLRLSLGGFGGIGHCG